MDKESDEHKNKNKCALTLHNNNRRWMAWPEGKLCGSTLLPFAVVCIIIILE